MFSLRVNISDSVFVGLNTTNQVAAQCDSLSKSVLRQAAAIVYRVLNNNRETGIISKKSDISTYVIDYVVDVEKEK